MRLPLLLALVVIPLASLAEPFEMKADIEEKLGAMLPLELPFTTQDGVPVQLKDIIIGSTPTVLILTWFECPMLCGLVLKGVINAVDSFGRSPGDGYRLLAVSFDARDTVPNAVRKREATLEALDNHSSAIDWPFLIGSEASINALTEAIGFRYAWEPSTKQFAHPAVVVVITPDGRISRYLYGIDFPARDFKLSIAEASLGHTLSTVDRVLLTCFRYDPASRRYGWAIVTFLRTGGSLILIGLVSGFVLLRRRERKRGES